MTRHSYIPEELKKGRRLKLRFCISIRVLDDDALAKKKRKKRGVLGDIATESGFSWRVVLFYSSISSRKKNVKKNNKQRAILKFLQKLLNLNGENDDNSR